MLVRLRGPVFRSTHGVARSVNGTAGELVQHREQPRLIVVTVIRGHTIRPRHQPKLLVVDDPDNVELPQRTRFGRIFPASTNCR